MFKRNERKVNLYVIAPELLNRFQWNLILGWSALKASQNSVLGHITAVADYTQFFWNLRLDRKSLWLKFVTNQKHYWPLVWNGNPEVRTLDFDMGKNSQEVCRCDIHWSLSPVSETRPAVLLSEKKLCSCMIRIMHIFSGVHL